MMSNRICGGCSLCCKVMGVPEVKEEHQWCPHARPGAGGCAIYRTRPERCRDFHCQWLIDEKLPEYWYPRTARIVINSKLVGDKKYIAFVVEPSYPQRWQQEPWFSDIKAIARAGLEGRLDQRWITVISIKGEEIPVVLEPPVKLARRPASDVEGTKTGGGTAPD